VQEARLERLDMGLTPMTDGWFVVGIGEAAWVHNEAMGAACVFEGPDVDFPEVGYTLAVIQPGQPSGMYHREGHQEDFLVLSGECLLLIEGEERRLRAWDFVHCPAGTEHGFVGAGEGPCVIFMTGGRVGGRDTGLLYPRKEIALRHDAGVEADTSASQEAYARFPPWRPGPGDAGDGPWAVPR
jgi:quercetin dioxygenase-like cupin family protein